MNEFLLDKTPEAEGIEMHRRDEGEEMGEEGRREEKQRRGEKTRFNGVTQDPSPTEPTQQQLPVSINLIST